MPLFPLQLVKLKAKAARIYNEDLVIEVKVRKTQCSAVVTHQYDKYCSYMVCKYALPSNSSESFGSESVRGCISVRGGL